MRIIMVHRFKVKFMYTHNSYNISSSINEYYTQNMKLFLRILRRAQTSYRKPSFLILESANVNLNTTISVRQQKVSHDISLVLSFLPLNFGRTRVVCLVSQR